MYSLAELNTILYNLGVLSGNIPRATNVRGGKLGAIPYQSAFGVTNFINPNRFTVRKFLTSVGDGTEGFIPQWEYIALSDLSDLDSVFVPKSLYNANTILTALLDNNPLPLNIQEQCLIGRLTGGQIASLTIAQVQSLLSIGGTMIYPGIGIPISTGAAWTTSISNDTSNTRKFLRELSVGGVFTTPIWDTFQASDIPQIDHGSLSDLGHDDHTQYAPKASPIFTGTVETPAIKITTGAGLAKVLTSDADGDATWETPGSGITQAEAIMWAIVFGG